MTAGAGRKTGNSHFKTGGSQGMTDGKYGENKLIDDLNMHENRAASLSAMNMGVNIVEIAALFLSSMFSLAAVKWCFVLMGSILVIISICGKSHK